MIHVVTPENRALYARELLQFHRLCAGAAPARDGADGNLRQAWGAYDPGDDDRALYFMALDGAGATECGCRVRPTDDWSILADVAPHLIGPFERDVRSETIWEVTGLCAASHLLGPDPGNEARRGELRLAVIEEAQERGILRLVTVVAVGALPAMLRCGWRVRLMGLPGDFQGGSAVALEIDPSREAVEDLRERLGVAAARRLRLPANASLGEAPLKEIEMFLEAAQRLGPNQLRPLLVALRAAIEDDEALEG